ncbi:hypothetical protein HG263_05825 [Pseudoalteromonas sp. JBTF-M23]|uniref:Uncharacterized protein n=1 Tax=Pseudoalteromonas caenipelagi TaxID=2726988 RepID=A0A849V9X5_9GAMM|nr:hypothetical protein [Pseudoalteromonas caenipelagi]NOU50056.1 hypothetical protein [Pseudoalteromonas caenipelagi]
MKTLATLLGALFTTISYANTLPVAQINTTEGYPYKHVIFKAQRVELHYSELENGIECRVKVVDDKLQHSSDIQQVSRKKFKQSPMAACLTRTTAKQILAKL